MRRKWMRTFSVLLIMCLLVSDNSLLEWETTAYATEDTEVVLTEDTGDSASSSQPEADDQENPAAEEGKTQEDGVTGDSGDASDGENTGDAGENGNTGAGENAGGSGNTGDSGNTSESGSTGDSGNTGESGNSGESGSTGDGGNTGESGSTEEIPETPEETPEETEETLETEETEETETLEDEIALFEGELDTPVGSKSLRDVTSAEEYADYYTSDSIYYIARADDFLLLQKLTQSYDFERIRFQIGTTGSEKVWKISDISGFEGFGSADHPFRGTMSCYYDSGFRFELDKPLFAYLGEGADIYQFDFTCVDGASAAIAKNIQVSGKDTAAIKIHDINITGVIKNTGENAGIIAGSIGDNAKVNIKNIKSEINNITGNNAGGIAGSLGDNVTITTEGNNWTAASVTGTATAGGYFGVVTGSYTWNTSELTLCQDFTVSDGDYAGQFAGKLCKGSGDSTLTVTGNGDITLNAKVNGGQTVGGLLGTCEKDTTLEVENPLTINGSVTAAKGQGSAGGLLGKVSEKITIKLDTYTGNATIGTDYNNKGYAGGVFGDITSDFTLESSAITVNGYIQFATGAGGFAGRIEGVNFCVPAMTVSAIIYSSNHVGGVVGYVNNSKVMVKNPTMKGSLTGETATGGIVGTVQNGNNPSALALDGRISVQSGSLSGGNCGALVGSQSESLIYLTGVGGKVDGASQLDFSSVAQNLEEIGQYGGVFRNQEDGGKKLIGGDGSVEQIGNVNGYAVSGADNTWTLKETAGMETLAIALNTQGNFGMEAFGSSSPDQSGIPTLLSGAYTLDGDADISYETTGIITVNRNDKTDDDTNKKYLFKGSLQGKTEGTVITQTSSVKQEKTGIFSTISGTPSFSNLVVKGTISNANGTGGIAYMSKGTGLTLENVVMEKTFQGNKGRIGGILAHKGPTGQVDFFKLTAKKIILDSKITGNEGNDFSGFVTYMHKVDLDLDEITLGGTILQSSSSNCGGFLGREWYWMSGTIKNVTVQAGTEMNVGTDVGGLCWRIQTANGQYMTFDNVNLENLKLTLNNRGGLIALNGQFLAANIVDYSCKGAIITTGADFDEVVYVTKDSTYTGIISLHNSQQSFPDYYYTNQATYTGTKPSKNTRTVYYYDLFQKIDENGNVINSDGIGSKITNHVLDSPEKLLIWSAYHHALKKGDYDLRRIFLKCFAENDFGDETYTLKGTLDLEKISFYAAPSVTGASLTGTDDATVIFHADKMDTTMGQHQGLHAGLLYNPTGGVTAENFTLEGTVANLTQNDSGALISGTLYGGGTFEKLTLKNLWIRDFNKGNEGDGLLIAKIAAGTGKQTTTVDVTFNEISMTGYSNTGVNGQKAAAALIGEAGGKDVTNLKLQFRNMQIADDADDSQALPKHNGDVLAFASFLYNYNFATNSDQNIGRGLYLFSEDEADDKVTWGKELDDTTEYWVYNGDDPHTIVFKDKPEVKENVENGYYKPYVYKVQEIEVNPKTGDLITGCGTYEDPYRIGTVKQFLTLYRYLSTKDGESTDSFTNWKVNKKNTGVDFCDKSTGHTLYTFGNEGFPTRDELSQAYYQLSADIDLSGITSGNYKVIADSFVGFGTSERPFIGVWSGKDENGVIHTVTLPKKTSAQTYTTYGFLQYAKGAVVKDMNIDIPKGTNKEGRTTIKTDGAAGGVIGCILGGDNLIDNVKVTGELSLVPNSASYIFTAAGGYVGLVKRGGLILRNVSLEDDLGEFTLYKNEEEINSACSNREFIYYAGAVCGRVEDGYVLYEGDSDQTSAIWQKGAKAAHGNLELIPDYAIVNGTYLDDQLKTSAVTLTEPADGQITVTLPNAAALQVMSMALNAGALNMVPANTDATRVYGYTERSRSRRAAYDKLGTKDSSENDYKTAVAYDDQVSYPYLYKYLGITKNNYTTYIPNNMSILNPLGKVNGVAYHTTWKLAQNQDYDLTVFGKAFRGIGSLYEASDAKGSTFRGNFDGQGSTVKYALEGLAMDFTVKADLGEVFPACLRRSGLFNTIVGYQDADCYETGGFTIQNLNLAGTVTTGDRPYYMLYAGGLIGYVNNARITVSQITVTQEEQITGGNWKGNNNPTLYASAGLIGYADGKQNITIDGCKVAGTKGKSVSITGNDIVAGMVGYVNLNPNNTLTIRNTDSAATVEWLNLSSSSEDAGGLIGYVNAGKIVIKGTESNPLTIQNITVDASKQAGAVIGETKAVKVTGENLKVTDSTITSGISTGGIIGEYGAYNGEDISSLKQITVTDVMVQEKSPNTASNTENGQGGVIGKCSGRITLENVTVGTANTTDSKVCKIQASDTISITNENRKKGVGGLVGSVAGTTGILTLKDCSVSDATVTAGSKSATATAMSFPVSVGGAVGYTGTQSCIIVTGAVTTENLTVTTFDDRASLGDTSRNNVNRFTAGGIFGSVRGHIAAVNTFWNEKEEYFADGLSAKNNTVTGMYAGGIIGYFDGTNNNNVWLKGKTGSNLVEKGTVTGGQAAGGIFGQVQNTYGKVCVNPETGTNAVMVSDVTISGMDAGGVVGSISASNNTRIENVQVENCTITASIPKKEDALVAGGSAAGGFVGNCAFTANGTLKLYNNRLDENKILYQTDSTTLQDKECGNEENFLSVGGIIGNVATANNWISGTIQADNLVLSPDNQLGVRKGADGTVQLIQKTGSSYQPADLTAPTGATNQEAITSLVDSYGLFVGTVIGTLNSTNVTINMMHIWNEENKYELPLLSQDNLPVVDVGRTGSQSSYAYRQNCHILYGDEKSDTAQGNLARMKQEVENSSKKYADTTTIPALLSCYRLNQVGDWSTGNTAQTPEEIWEDVYPLTLEVDGAEQELPIFVCKPGARSLNETITALSDIMTNVSGLSSSKMDILTVIATPKKWNVTQTHTEGYNGAAADSGVKSHIAVTKSGSGYTFSYLDSTTGSGEELFDQYDETTKTLTYTELTYTYQWSDGSGTHRRDYVLPIFVEEPLQVNVEMSIQAGRVNSVEAMENASKDSVVMANDSDSTLLLEYTYGKARKSYDVTMPKKLWMTEGTAENALKYSVGTKLLLIDVTGGNKPYYYTVSASTGDQISFTEFTDSAGNPYKERQINREDFEGTEQFLLQTIRSDTGRAAKTMYDIHTGICDLGDEMLNKIQGTLEDKINVDSIPGITITLDNPTNVEGKLTANGELVYTMQFSITGEQAYWQKEHTIDSANNDKYLDLACYLMNEKQTERVSLPSGTNFQYRLTADSYSDLQMIPDQSGIYYYKAVRDRYSDTNSKFLIRGVDENGKIIGVTENTTVSLQVKFKLPGELTGISDSRYTACIDLLRTDNPDYPSGYEDALGTYRKTLDATVVPDIGFAVQVDEADWEKLGINTYESLDKTYEIPFTVQLDLREILRYASGDELLNQWAAKDYCITFDIFNKAKDMTYDDTTPFKDSQSFTDPAGNALETMQIRMDGGEETWMWKGSAYEAVAADTYAYSKGGELTMKYHFSKEQLEATKKGTPITLKGTLLVNGTLLRKLSTQADFEKYLTNYRMNASLRITEASDSLPTGNVDTFDYFVYTITRLKTDM